MPAAVQATNCDGSPAAGWQSIPPGTLLCADTNITFVFTNACGDTTSYTGTVTVAPCCVAPPSAMVLWLTFDETVGITCLNSAGHNNGYRYEGNNYANHLNGPSHNVGQYVNNSLTFDGSDDKVVVPNYGAIDFNSNNFSMDAWVKWNGGPATETLLDHRTSSLNHPVGYEWFIAAGKPGVQLDNGNINSFTAAKPIPSNVWTHLAATVQRGSTSGVMLYTNGALSDSFNISGVSGSFSNRMDLWVGAPELPVNDLFNGSLDEIELFNQALPAYEIADIYDAGRAGKCRPTCSVPAVTSICIGARSVTVSVQICNCGSSAMNFNVSFGGLTAAQAGGSPATNGPTGFSNYPSSVTLPPDDCTNFTVDITIPSYLTPAKVMYYQMIIQDGLGQQFSSIGEITDPVTIYSANCYPYVTPINPTGSLIWTKSTNVVFVINNPTDAPINLTSTVVVLNGNLEPDTNLVSLNNLPPGTPVTNQLPFAPYESLPLNVNVNYLDSQPWTPFYLVLMLNIGDSGAFVPVASITFAQVAPPTVGPPLSASATNGQVIISWDIVNRGWTLRSAANLGGTNWIPVSLPVLPLPDGSQGITTPATNQAQFFQLIGPSPP